MRVTHLYHKHFNRVPQSVLMSAPAIFVYYFIFFSWTVCILWCPCAMDEWRRSISVSVICENLRKYDKDLLAWCFYMRHQELL